MLLVDWLIRRLLKKVNWQPLKIKYVIVIDDETSIEENSVLQDIIVQDLVHQSLRRSSVN